MNLAAALGAALVLSWAMVGAGAWVLNRQLEAEKRASAELREALGREKQSRVGFEAAAQKCTASVAELQARAERIAARFAAGKAAAERREQELAKHVNDLLTRPAALDECAGMKEELNAEIDLRAARR